MSLVKDGANMLLKSQSMTNLIIVRDLHFSYGKDKRKILNGVNLHVSRGEVIGIVGPSGGGKSTLLYALCGIIPKIYQGALEGQVKLWDKDIKDLKLSQISQKIGIVFQDPDSQLFSPTVEDEIAFGPENLCMDPKDIGLRIEASLKAVHMEKHRYANPNNLSGGEKQLIAMASVLAMEPDILLFDEIRAQVDLEGKKALGQVIKDLKSQGKTIVLVEHDLNNLQDADRILELKDGQLIDFKDGDK